MGKLSDTFSITYRPRPEEFQEYKDSFLQQFKKRYRNEKFIVCPERAGEEEYNHYQIILKFDKEKRQDSLKNQIKRFIGKVTNPKIALVVKSHNDAKGLIGYVIKENEYLDEVHINGFTESELEECRQYYQSRLKIKHERLDKIRVSIKNLPIIVKRYVEDQHSVLNAYKRKDYPLKHPEEYEYSDIRFIIGVMGQNEYQLYNLMVSNNYAKVVKLVMMFMNKNLCNY